MLEKLRELSEEIVIRTEKDTKYGTVTVRTPTPVIKLDKAIEFFKELQEKLEITEKAFELACKTILDIVGNCPYDNFNLEMPKDCEEQCGKEMKRYYCWDKYFKTKVKEMKSE